MFKKILSKLLGSKPSQSDAEIIIDEKIAGIRGFFKKSGVFLQSLIENTKNECISIIKKCKNLLETNYKLGMKHLENGNLSDAIFRFRFIKKVWPEFYEAHYRLAYCLVLKGKIFEAREVLAELLQKDPNNSNAIELFNQIKESDNQNDNS